MLRADGDRQARILQAEGQAKAIRTVFDAIHAANPSQKVLAYQYLQALPQIANGAANKVWIVPAELTKALEGMGGALGGLSQMVGDSPRRRRSTAPSEVEREAAEAAQAAAAAAQQIHDEVRVAEAQATGGNGAAGAAGTGAGVPGQPGRATRPTSANGLSDAAHLSGGKYEKRSSGAPVPATIGPEGRVVTRNRGAAVPPVGADGWRIPARPSGQTGVASARPSGRGDA